MEPEKQLPGLITSITPQKNNRDRYSVFVDDGFLIGVADDTLLKHGLKIGLEVTPSLFKKLQRDEGYNSVKNYMLKLLGNRQHARKELLRKAKRKDYSADIIEDVLYELEEKNYINDERFARKFAEDKSSSKKWGPRKIISHLIKRGIQRTTAQNIINDTFKPVNIRKRLEELILKRQKKLLREEDKFKRKQKAVNYLLQKGYYSSDIFKYIDALLGKVEKQT